MRAAVVAVWVAAGCGGGGPVTDQLPCVEDDADVAVYRVKKSKAGSYTVRVDTVSDADTFDPAVSLWTVTSWTDSVASLPLAENLNYSDDEFPCTFPPPEYECPEFIQSVPEPAEDLAVIVEVVGSCVGANARYELIVERDTKPVKLERVATGKWTDLEFPIVDTGF